MSNHDIAMLREEISDLRNVSSILALDGNDRSAGALSMLRVIMLRRLDRIEARLKAAEGRLGHADQG